jgi:prepilin-type N-terminal cleavage/methylation domain-containing protein
MRVPGFTLIELLVVILIITIAMALIATSMDKFDREAAVRTAAEGLAGTMRQARMMAITSQAPHAVVFHIQNAPGSSGRILNNRSGGHWYRILGPSKSTTGRRGAKSLLIPYMSQGGYTFNQYDQALYTLPHYIEALKECWAGPAIALPGKRVRFLALSETDEGNRIHADNQENAQRDSAYAYAPTYPRPWFGYFDSSMNRLFPWGGYDHQLGIDQPWTRITNSANQPITNYTGFFYAGKETVPITGSRNPADRIYNVDWNQDGLFTGPDDPVRGPETGYAVLRANEPRPLVNADWGDAMIIFMPNGDAYAPPFGCARKRYRCVQLDPSLYNPSDSNTRWRMMANGVSDMARPWTRRSGVGLGQYPTASNDYRGTFETWLYNSVDEHSEASEFGYFREHLGGWNITLASDSLDDNDSFATAADALKSLGPIYRVFVGQRGLVEVIRVRMRSDDWLDGKSTFPSDPAFFTGQGATYAPNNAAYMGKNFRWGWLHHDKPKDGSATFVIRSGSTHTAAPDMCVPRGRPIAYDVCPRMLKDKIWWLE